MLTTKQNRQRHSKLNKIYAKGRKHHKKPRPSQRPSHLQSKHETRVLAITVKRYDTSAGYWPIQALIKLADLGIYSAVEYWTKLIDECIEARLLSPYRKYESKPLEDKYYHGIPNNISFQKLLARLQASTPVSK